MACFLLWYGLRVRALVVRRIGQLEDQRRLLGRDCESVDTMLHKYCQAALKVSEGTLMTAVLCNAAVTRGLQITWVLVTWNTFWVFFVVRAVVDPSAPGLYAAMAVFERLAYAAQALTKVWAFPAEPTSCCSALLPRRTEPSDTRHYRRIPSPVILPLREGGVSLPRSVSRPSLV